MVVVLGSSSGTKSYIFMKNIINRKDITLPTKEELDKILLQTLSEVSSLRILIERMNDGHKFSNQYIIAQSSE